MPPSCLTLGHAALHSVPRPVSWHRSELKRHLCAQLLVLMLWSGFTASQIMLWWIFAWKLQDVRLVSPAKLRCVP